MIFMNNLELNKLKISLTKYTFSYELNTLTIYYISWYIMHVTSIPYILFIDKNKLEWSMSSKHFVAQSELGLPGLKVFHSTFNVVYICVKLIEMWSIDWNLNNNYDVNNTINKIKIRTCPMPLIRLRYRQITFL